MDIKVLGPGCMKCKMLEKNVEDAVREMGVDAQISKVTDLKGIMEYNVMMTPGLVINGKVKSMGRVPKPEEIKLMIESEM